MGSISIRRWMMAALIALFVSMLVIATTADAAACGTEVGASQSVLALDASEKTDSRPDAESGRLCAHGHAHHDGVALPNAADSTSTIAVGARVEPHSFAHPLASREPAGPERPPRA